MLELCITRVTFRDINYENMHLVVYKARWKVASNHVRCKAERGLDKSTMSSVWLRSRLGKKDVKLWTSKGPTMSA